MIRKTVERSERGVVLIRVEDLSAANQPVSLGYRLSTPSSVFVIVDRDTAHAAFWAEVNAPDPRMTRARAAVGR